MAGMTSYLQKKLLDHLLSIASYTVPSTIYVSLHKANPGEAGSHANEVSGGGYARQSILAKMGATDSVTGISVNTSTLTFGPASADWGTITFIGFEDAVSGGNMLAYGAPTSAKTVATGQSITMIAGQLSIQFD